MWHHGFGSAAVKARLQRLRDPLGISAATANREPRTGCRSAPAASNSWSSSSTCCRGGNAANCGSRCRAAPGPNNPKEPQEHEPATASAPPSSSGGKSTPSTDTKDPNGPATPPKQPLKAPTSPAQTPRIKAQKEIEAHAPNTKRITKASERKPGFSCCAGPAVWLCQSGTAHAARQCSARGALAGSFSIPSVFRPWGYIPRGFHPPSAPTSRKNRFGCPAVRLPPRHASGRSCRCQAPGH